MAHHEIPALPGGDLVPGVGSFRRESPVTPDLQPSQEDIDIAFFADAFAKLDEAIDVMTGTCLRALDAIAPAIRRIDRYVRLRAHRRHQDERRCVAKAGRRERTGWRQSA